MKMSKLKKVFIGLCEDLKTKHPEKESHFNAVIREINNYPNYPLFSNLGDTVLTYYGDIDDVMHKKIYDALLGVD